MATKILTGLLIPKAGKQQNGEAVILFYPFKVVGDALGVELYETGPAGSFSQPPGKVVSLRHIKVADRDTLLGGSETDIININDGPPSTHHMTVQWHASGGSEARELSFLMVGEAQA